jgi:hypothetical protein
MLDPDDHSNRQGDKVDGHGHIVHKAPQRLRKGPEIEIKGDKTDDIRVKTRKQRHRNEFRRALPVNKERDSRPRDRHILNDVCQIHIHPKDALTPISRHDTMASQLCPEGYLERVC